MIVDRILDAAPRPFETDKVNREFLSYEDFIYFMLSGKLVHVDIGIDCYIVVLVQTVLIVARLLDYLLTPPLVIIHSFIHSSGRGR
jgi:hypothetical protein